MNLFALALQLISLFLLLLGLGLYWRRSKPNAWLKLSLIALAVLILASLWQLDLLRLVHLDRVAELQAWIQGFGWFAPLLFILFFALAAVLFLPAIPFTLVAAIAFGPVWGTLYASLGSTLGACLAFLVSRYLLRDLVYQLVSKQPKLGKIDQGVKQHGWRMLMISRLVPIFPFNAQNYVYGATAIPFVVYALCSWIFMLPGTAAYVLITGAALSGASLGWMMTYFALGAILLVGLSLLPSWLKNRQQAAELLTDSTPKT